MNGLIRDIRFSFRLIRKTPWFSAAIVLTFALGIGANTIVFSAFSALLLRPLPFGDPDRLVALYEESTQFPGRTPASIPNFIDWRLRNRVFESLAASSTDRLNCDPGTGTERVALTRVSDRYFETLKVTPLLGRCFRDEEFEPGRDNVVVLSHAYWQSRFGGHTEVLGRAVVVDGAPKTIVGVMPALRGEFEPDLWGPLHLNPHLPRDLPFLARAIGRLKPRVSVEKARSEMRRLASELEKQYPATNTGKGVLVSPLSQDQFGESYTTVQLALILLVSAATIVLLICCLNVGNLLLSRAANRYKELAMRQALGASSWGLLRQSITESCVLAGFGGAAGLLLAYWCCELIHVDSFFVDLQLGTGKIEPDSLALVVTVVLSMITGIAAGLIPAARSGQTQLYDVVKAHGIAASPVHSGERLKRALVVSEIALSLLLLVGAGLALKSLHQLVTTNPGFSSRDVLTMYIDLNGPRYPDPKARSAFYQQLLTRLVTLPGIEAVGVTSVLPISGASNIPVLFGIEGRVPPAGSEGLLENFQIVSPGYFDSLSIGLKQGRKFSQLDSWASTPVAMINESMARKYWRGQDPVGATIEVRGIKRTIVGVVADMRLFRLEQEPNAQLFFPFTQMPRYGMYVTTRSRGDTHGTVARFEKEIRSLDLHASISQIRALDDIIEASGSVAGQRLLAGLLATFAGLASILAMVGVFAVLAYWVSQNTREIGIRMALGAKVQAVLWDIMLQGVKVTMLGVGIGLIGSALFSRTLDSLLVRVSSLDPGIFLSVTLLQLAVSLLACYFSARRATRIDPLIALRSE